MTQFQPPVPPRGAEPQEEPIVDLREGSSEPQRVGDGGESGMDRPTLHRDSLACSPGETDRHSTVSPQPAAPLGATEPPASEPQAASVSALVLRLEAMAVELRKLDDKLTCVETRAVHPNCDFCGESLGLPERAITRAATKLMLETAVAIAALTPTPA